MILDLIIIGIVLLCIIFGYKRGLVEVAFNLISFIIAIVLSLLLYQPITNYIIDNTNFDESIKEVIVNHMNPKDIKETTEEIEESKSENENLPDIVTNYIEKTISEVANSAKTNAVEIVANNLSITAIKIITLILLFFAIRLILYLLKFITNIIAKLPVINSINKLGGIVYGVIEGLFIIYLILAIAMAISTMTGNTEILTYINGSMLGKMMFNNNILLKIIFK